MFFGKLAATTLKPTPGQNKSYYQLYSQYHSPKFATVINPTLKTDLLAMMTAAAAWFN
jgi:hypothetical protein